MTAAEVKDALRRRHPALDPFGGCGQWTTIEEWHNIDLLAFNAWSSGGPRYGRVGYEVKVSRSDYRRELLHPDKRAGAVAFCHEFFFAVPKGLLKPEETTFVEPPELQDRRAYERERCPGYYGARCTPGYRPRRRSSKGPHMVRFGHGRNQYGWSKHQYDVVCPICSGKGFILPSLAERICPQLWVPADVGLIEIDGAGCHVTRRAPRRQPRGLNGALEPFTDHVIAGLVRHASFRGDPRHIERDQR